MTQENEAGKVDAPRLSRSKRLEAAEMEGAERSTTVTMPSSGDLNREELLGNIVEVEPVSAYGAADKAARLAFMEEKVDVMVHESADPNAEPIVETWCNGVPQRFLRGQVQTVRRKFVEVLARAKNTGITTRADVDRNGNANTAIGKHTALKYPFSVMRDENPKGATWLKQVMAQA